MGLRNGIFTRLLPAFIGALSGCQSGEPSFQGARAAIMETPGPGPNLTRMILDDPHGLLEVETWMKKYYQEPPDRNEMGAVLAQAGLIVSREGDPSFSKGPDRKWELYMYISTREREILIPREHMDKFFEIFRRYGRTYEGMVRTGAYGTELPKGSPPVEK